MIKLASARIVLVSIYLFLFTLNSWTGAYRVDPAVERETINYNRTPGTEASSCPCHANIFAANPSRLLMIVPLLTDAPVLISQGSWSESPAKSQNSLITACGDRRTANDFKWLQPSQRTFACPRTEKIYFLQATPLLQLRKLSQLCLIFW